MATSRFVIGFYRSEEHAREALDQARKSHFRRSGVVHHPEDGRLSFHSGVGPGSRVALGTVLAALSSMAAQVTGIGPVTVALVGLTSFAIAWFGSFWLGFGLRQKVLRQHARYVLPGETALVVRETEARIPDVVAALTRVTHRSVFVIRPGLRKPLAETAGPDTPQTVTMASLPDCAAALASSHRLDASTKRSRPLLPVLRECEAGIESARADLAEAARLGHGITHAAEWVLDNAYLIRSHIADVRHNLPNNYNRILPVLENAVHPVRLRIYHLAAELIDRSSSGLTEESIVAFLDGYQRKTPLVIAELWVFPLMLRLVLLERLRRLSELTSRRQHQKERADFWADRLLNAANRGSEQFDALVRQLDRDGNEPTAHFVARLGELLLREESALAPIHQWIETRTGSHLADHLLHAHSEEANDLMSITSTIGSLRRLSELQYSKIVESVSRIESILDQDPAGIHAQSDFETRDRSRRCVEEFARQSKQSEWALAQQAVELARRAPSDSPRGSAAYYLLDDGVGELERQVGRRVPWRERGLRLIFGHPTLFYLGSLAALSGTMAGGFLFAAHTVGVRSPAILLLLGTLALAPTTELAVQLLQMLFAWILPARVLPKLSFEHGIPEEYRTLVVVPMMLLTPDSIRGELEKLEVRYLSNPDPNLHFALLADFTDATEREMPEDDGLLGLAEAGIEKLNARHRPDQFVLFHRQRVWCETEARWIGWERKRGKLEELNQLLNGEESGLMIHAGAPPAGIRYVITLDADTQLPHTTARRLIETIAHPLNQVRLADDQRRRLRGYTIIQPRVSITLPSATASRFSRLFTDARGSDPYCRAVSDLYQDLFGDAIYHGKAIYDVQAFHKLLTGRFPEQRLLSHDLIEGAYAGVGLATDIELFEQFPYDYTSYSKRQHRWIRGDWQIASWILGRVPEGQRKRRTPNPLTFINRWKILDNLRRSLLAPGVLLFLILGWSLDAAPAAASALVAMVLVVPLGLELLERLVQRLRGDVGALVEASSALNRAIVMAAFLPHQAFLAIDAIGRVGYRLLYSRRHLLEWQTAEVSHANRRSQVDAFRAQFFLISALAAVALVVMGARGVVWETTYTPFLLFWVAAPGVQYWIGWQRRAVRKREEVDEGDRLYLRRVARETWRYFDDLVGPGHNWLPPDNSQEALQVEIASRTSPTNIGMWLMAAVSAGDLGYLTPEDSVERCSATVEILGTLDTYEGHLFNWYDTRSLAPLEPRYVSTADSGNLIASLWVLSQATQELETKPQVDGAALQGLADILMVITERFPPDHTITVPIDTLRELLQEESSSIRIMERIRLAAEPAHKLTESLRWSVSETDERVYWITRLDREIQTWVDYFDRHLKWVDVLFAPPDEFLLPLGEGAIQARRSLLTRLPSWADLAGGQSSVVRKILRAATNEQTSEKLAAWIRDFRAAFDSDCKSAAALLARAKRLSEMCEDLTSAMDMAFLYDDERRLFGIGYPVGAPRTFSAHYDLLASEARLGSLVAIAKDDVPAHHWLVLGRPYTSSRGQILLSWSGTMFEYLMPLLFTQSFRNSLLESACAAAVDRQIEYGRERGVPWGISESAYSALDAHKIYQYRAFGVPSLGLKRGLEDDLVVAPYASALALLVYPMDSIRNLRRLERAGMYGRMGFYESLDYTRQEQRRGTKGVIVYTYMAHHQGMSLMAIDNVLNLGIMRRRFHRDRRIRAVEPLLFERIPPQPSMLVHRPSHHVPLHASETSLPAYRVLDEDTPIPRVHLLGNERYAVMITNVGSGYSRWHAFDITRWRSDVTRDNWGMYFYLREGETQTLWSVTHQPLNDRDPRYTATFTADRAEFRRRKFAIESHLDVTVSPDDDAEIRRLTLTNHGLRARSLTLTSAVELSLAPHEADRAHPAFSKLFIQTEALPELKALIAWRRLRSEDEEQVWVAQFIVEKPAGEGSFGYETNRANFPGRGRSWENPEFSLDETDGYVLDPIFAIQRQFSLDPREQMEITFITVAAPSRDALMRLIEKYRDPDACGRTFELAWSHSQLEYRYLGIQGDAAFRFSELASHLLYPNTRMRAPLERLRRNLLGQSNLWTYGISGDMPLVAVSVKDSEGLALVREVLVAHTWWRLRGFRADLVILNREPVSYEQPVHEQLQRLVEVHSLHTGVDQPGGVFLRKADHIPDEALNLILAVAQATLGAVRGPLAKQLSRPPSEAPQTPRRLETRTFEEQPSAPLPFLELAYFNGIGGFTGDGREYAIYLGPGTTTPQPWINVISNPVFGTLVSESGSGCSWYGNSQTNRITPWANDPVSDTMADAIYVRDDDTGVFWTPTPMPVRELDAYRTRHGQGYTEFEHNSHALDQTLLTFVPMRSGDADPIRVQRLRIRNRSSRRRRLSVTSYAELVLGQNRESTQMHISCAWDAETGALVAHNPYHPQFGQRIAFAAMTPRPTSYTSDRTEFLGRNGSPRAPASLNRVSLSDRTGIGLDPCAALQTQFELGPNEEKTVILVLGQADDLARARASIKRHCNPAEAERAFSETREWWDGLLTTIQVETPVMAVDLLLNRWLLYQALSCRIWGRTALYQSSGAFGFRDQLQDALALVYAAPDVARRMILHAASHQFIEGDVQHWWHPSSGEGLRSRCSDDLLWLPYAALHYETTTGDTTIWDSTEAFLEGPQLRDEESEAYFRPAASGEHATLFEHCRRAIGKASTCGPHGLPLIGTGDWNDGMNSVGDEGRGESVWLAWFLVDIWQRFAHICDERDEPRLAREYREHAVRMAATIEETSWDGAWYRRGYFDDGTPLGSSENPEARIDSLPQSWAVISGAGNPHRVAQAMNSVDAHLIRRTQKAVLLFTPPFDHSSPHPGYIMGYPPGVRENGGQYTHAALWVAMAFARMGDGERAVEVLQMLNPVEHARTPEDVATYRTEPYAVAADVYSAEGQSGRGGWTWYTGSAGWMYRVWLEEVLGFRLRGNQLQIKPAIPADWPGYAITFRFGQSEYRIEVEHGPESSGNEILLADDGQSHTIRIMSRQPNPTDEGNTSGTPTRQSQRE